MAILLLSLLQIANAFSILLSNKTTISNIIPGYEQIQGLRALAREMKQDSGQLSFKGFTRQLQLEQISFSYPGEAPALTKISMSILKGQMIAFVGNSVPENQHSSIY